jgi:hypothetical protein
MAGNGLSVGAGVAGICGGGDVGVAVRLGGAVSAGELWVGAAALGAICVSAGLIVGTGEPRSGELKIHAGMRKTINTHTAIMGLRMRASIND